VNTFRIRPCSLMIARSLWSMWLQGSKLPMPLVQASPSNAFYFILKSWFWGDSLAIGNLKSILATLTTIQSLFQRACQSQSKDFDNEPKSLPKSVPGKIHSLLQTLMVTSKLTSTAVREKNAKRLNQMQVNLT